MRVLKQHGIDFTCGEETASLAFQAVYHGWLGLQGQEANRQAEVAGLLLDSVIDRVVLD